MLSIDLDLSDVLTDVCDVKANATAKDDYGQTTSVGSVTKASGVACKLLPYVSRRGGRENKAENKAAFANFTLYMFPIEGLTLDEHMWITLTSTNGQAVANPRRYDITTVVDPVVAGAPLEVYLELVKP